jgi:hypothetical protein
MSTIMEGQKMKRFLVVAEVEVDDKKYNEVVTWNVEPSDWVTSVLADHGRDRGMVIKMRTTENDYHMFADVNRAVEAIAKDKAFDELGEELLKNQLCVSGNCGE